MDNLTFDEIWQVWQKEKQSSKLQQISKTFYEDIFKYIKNTQSNSEIQKTTQENLLRITNNIYERRKQKILIYLAYNQNLPQPLPKSETQLYTRLSEVLKNEKLESSEEESRDLLVLQDIPKVILPSGKEIGPLEKEQTIKVEDEYDENFLINNSICKRV